MIYITFKKSFTEPKIRRFNLTGLYSRCFILLAPTFRFRIHWSILYANYVCIICLSRKETGALTPGTEKCRCRGRALSAVQEGQGADRSPRPSKEQRGCGDIGTHCAGVPAVGPDEGNRSTAASHGASWGDRAAAYSTRSQLQWRLSTPRSQINQMRRIPQRVQVHDCYSPGDLTSVDPCQWAWWKHLRVTRANCQQTTVTRQWE